MIDLFEDDIILFCSITDFGNGSKALKLAKKIGALGGTIFLGKGTVRNELLNMFGVKDIRKEIFITVIGENDEDIFYKEMTEKFRLDKPHHGIAFSVPLKSCMKISGTNYISSGEKKGVNNLEAIFVIVEKGLSEDVLEAAKQGGSTGGTIIHGRGSSPQEKEKLFDFVIEPEKEIILILSKTGKTQSIVDSVKEKLNMDEPNSGVIFVVDVTRTIGLYENKEDN